MVEDFKVVDGFQLGKVTKVKDIKENILERSNNHFGSAGYKHNHKKINNEVGVDFSRRLHRLKVKQNRIENDCAKTLYNNTTCCCNSNNSSDFKVHTRRNGMYERYYLKLGRDMFSDGLV